MSSITYNGHDFSPLVAAELVEPIAHAVAPEAARVAGRPGLALLSAEVGPLELRVRLLMDAPDALTAVQRSEARGKLRAWLLSTEGATLVVPGEPGLAWHDVLCTGVSDWSSLFSDGTATVTFECLDPIAFGAARSSDTATLEVGGTWPTWPTMTLVASAGGSVRVSDPLAGTYLSVSREFAAGDTVTADFERQTVRVNGADATSEVDLGSDFFPLVPGTTTLEFSGCSSHVVRWSERWA